MVDGGDVPTRSEKSTASAPVDSARLATADR